MTSTLPQEIQAARLRLVKDRPYLASAAWALQPVSRPGMETLAVDMWWRLYYDPAVITRWTVEELAGVLYHEIMHLLRDHPGRMQNFIPHLANLAADAEINDDLLAEKIVLPGNAVTPASIGQPDKLLAEEYYAALESQMQQPAPGQGASVQQEDGEISAQDTDSDSAPGSESGDESDPNPTPESGGQADGTQSDDRGNDSAKGDSDGSESGDGEKGESNGATAASSANSPASSQASDSSRSESSSQPPDSPGSGHGNGQDGGKPDGGQGQTPAPGAGRCGSCATGQQEPWEEGPPGEGTSSGISQAEAELIRRDVARQIQEHVQTRGTIPGHWKRWADEKLRPKVDWRKELAAMVRHAVADVAGASDYSYRRPSRRQGQVGNGKVVLPSLRRPVPSVAVVVDTSGSIDDAMLARSLAEISGILKGLGQRESVHVLAVDSQVHTCQRIFKPEQVKVAGGGGTDMGAGLYAASKIRPIPQVCVVITDGFTPWPDAAPKGMKVVVALTGEGKAPDWAKTVKMEGGSAV